jgi:hypothetical protein
MLLDIREQCGAPSNGDVDKAAVEPALLGRGELCVSAHQTGPELFTGFTKGSFRGNGFHAQQAGGYLDGFRLDLRVPQKALGEIRQRHEGAFGEFPVGGGFRPGRVQTTAAGRFAQFWQGRARLVVRGPGADGLADRHQQLRTQRRGGSAAREAVQQPLERAGGHELGGGSGGSQAQECVVARGEPVAGQQHGCRVVSFVDIAAQLGDEVRIRLPEG